MSRLNLLNLPIGSFIFLLSPSHPTSVAVNWQSIFYGPPSLAPTDLPSAPPWSNRSSWVNYEGMNGLLSAMQGLRLKLSPQV